MYKDGPRAERVNQEWLFSVLWIGMPLKCNSTPVTRPPLKPLMDKQLILHL